MAKQQLVYAFYGDEAAAGAAASAIKKWDMASKEIKRGGVDVLVKDDKGQIKAHMRGSRHVGAGIVIGAIVGILPGGISLLGGAIAGGIIGAFIRTGTGLSEDDRAKIGGELDAGKAAVCVLAKPEDAASVSAKLAQLGGQAEPASA